MQILVHEKKIVILAILVSIIIGSCIDAQTICNMSGDDLTACRPSATPPRPPPPSAKCCSALSHADFRCLCSYKNSKLLPSLGIDPNLAVQLPDKCKLPHPSHC
ncbi:hypothetical protein ACS0TY_012656 [Phlomoides rotata]